MSDQLLGIFKFGFLGLLYLFFARVVWAVWSEVRGPRPGAPQRTTGGHSSLPHSGAGHSTVGDATAPVQRVGASPMPPSPPVAGAAPVIVAARPAKALKGRRGTIARLVVLQPKVRKGAAFALGAEITVGRGAECSISIPDDHFVSQLHARVYRHDGSVVVDDLGSTNGTFLNGNRVSGARPLVKGDRLQIGNTVLEAQ